MRSLLYSFCRKEGHRLSSHYSHTHSHYTDLDMKIAREESCARTPFSCVEGKGYSLTHSLTHSLT
jgi:hypothetical protein